MDESVSVTEQAATPYHDDDLVYVDPKLRIVVSRVEWNLNGRPKSLPMKDSFDEADDADEKDASSKKNSKRPRRQRFYPWGTYRSMKRIYKLEGKLPRVESSYTLNDVLEKALKEPFWD